MSNSLPVDSFRPHTTSSTNF